MKLYIEEPSRPIIPLPVVVTIAIYGVYWVWYLWLLCTLKYVGSAESTGVTMISSEAYWGWASLSGAGILWLVVSMCSIWKRQDSLRIPHLAGTGMGVLLLAGMQAGLWVLHSPGSGQELASESLLEVWKQLGASEAYPWTFPLWR